MTLQRQQHAARVQAATWGQALQALAPLLSARYGLGPDDAIDSDGHIRRGVTAEPEGTDHG